MENRRSKRIGDFDWFFCTRRSRFASRRLLQVWVSSQVLIERPGYSVRLSLSAPDAPERPLVVVTSHLSASLKRGLGSRPPVRRLRSEVFVIPGQVKYPGLIQVTGFYQLLPDFHPVGYRTGYAVHKADRTSQCTVVDIKVGVDFRRRSPGLLPGILVDGV